MISSIEYNERKLKKDFGDEDAVIFLLACSYLTYRDRDEFLNLFLKSKDNFGKLLNKKLSEEDEVNIDVIKIFKKRVRAIIKNIDETKYQDALKGLRENDSKSIFSEARKIMFGGRWGRPSSIIDNRVDSDDARKVIAKLIDVQSGDKLMDPTIGVGELVVTVLEKRFQMKKDVQVIGREVSEDALIFLYVNFIINDLNDVVLFVGDTIKSPKKLEESKYDLIVQEVPIGKKLVVSLKKDVLGRFPFGIPPQARLEWAYISNSIYLLSEKGKAYIAIPENILLRGGVESNIRQSVVDSRILETVITFKDEDRRGATILIFNKENMGSRDSIQFIKANGRLLSWNAQFDGILDVVKTKKEVKGIAKNVKLNKIINGNLDIEQYIPTDKFRINGEKYKIDFDELSEVDTIKLGKIADFIRGLPITSKDEIDDGQYRAIRISDLSENELDVEKLIKIDVKESQADRYLVKKGDILIAARGNVDKVMYIDKDYDNVVFNSNILVIRLNQDYSSQWLKYYLETPLAKILISRVTKDYVMRQLTAKDLGELLVPKISLEEQQQLMSYVDNMAKIEKELEILKQREQEIKEKFLQQLGVEKVITIIDGQKKI